MSRLPEDLVAGASGHLAAHNQIHDHINDVAASRTDVNTVNSSLTAHIANGTAHNHTHAGLDTQSDAALFLRRSVQETWRNASKIGTLVRPDQYTTGYRGVALTPYTGTYTTTADGQVIDRMSITGDLIVVHKNVIVNECWIKNRVRNNHPTDKRYANLFLFDTEIGSVTNPGPTGVGVNTTNSAGIYFEGYTAVRCNIHHMGDGLKGGNEANVYGCWLHDFYTYDIIFNNEPDTEHADGLQAQGFSRNVDIIGNYFDVRLATDTQQVGGANACLQIQGAQGITDNLRVHDNWLRLGSNSLNYLIQHRTGGYTLAPTPTNVYITRNHFIMQSNNYGAYIIDGDPIVFDNVYETAEGEYIGPVDPRSDGTVAGVHMRSIINDAPNQITTPGVAGRTPQSLYLEIDIAAHDYTTGAFQRVFTCDNGGNPAGSRQWSLGVTADGKIAFLWSANGSSFTQYIDADPLPVVDYQRIKIGIWLEANVNPYKLHIYLANGNEPLREVRTVVGAGATSVKNDVAVPYTINGRNANIDRFNGYLFYACMRNGGPTGSLVVEFNPSLVTDATFKSPTTLVSPTTGETWTKGGNVRWVGEPEKTHTGMLSQTIPRSIGNPGPGTNLSSAKSDHGHQGWNPTIATTNYTAVAGDLVLADTTSSAVIVTLPASETGASFAVRKTTGANAVTVDGTALVNGVGTAFTVTAYVQFVCDGINWHQVA